LSAASGLIRIIWNPASGRGRGARAIGGILGAFAAHGVTDARGTRAAGDEARLVHEAIADGVETIVVAGGVGTGSKCAVALARAGSPARMAFVAAGTGNDFAKNLRANAKDPRVIAALVANADGRAVERRVDLGRVDDAWFLNVAGFGFDVACLEASARSPFLRGPPVYVAAAIKHLFAFAGLEARVGGVRVIDPAVWARRLLMVFSNGRDFGGTFRIAPPARVDDGCLDAVIFADGAPQHRVPLLARAMAGTHLSDPVVRHTAASEFSVTFRGPTAYELDGELGRTVSSTATIASVPGALRVLDTPS
jgi:diacylglycerol kinase (ATP)